MKRIFALLIGVICCAAIARAGGVTVEAIMTTSSDGKETTTFTADTPTLFAMFKTQGASNGDKIRAVWIADDVGDVAPKGFKIDERTFIAKGDTSDGEFSLSKPDGWPLGQYHVEIYVNDELATKIKFTVKPAANVNKHSDKEEESGN